MNLRSLYAGLPPIPVLYLNDSLVTEKGVDRVRPLQISAETAVKLAEALDVPLERLMHMPQHILLQKMMELAKQEESAESPVEPKE